MAAIRPSRCRWEACRSQVECCPSRGSGQLPGHVAIIIRDSSSCAICGDTIRSEERIVATPAFIEDADDPLWKYSDAGMHSDCFLRWELRDAFIDAFNTYWSTHYRSMRSMEPDGTITERDPSSGEAGKRAAAAGQSVRWTMDPWNPTAEEVREWAFDAGAPEPCQDWDLSLSWVGYESTYLSLAADHHCPKRTFFVHMLYFMVGDAVRNDFASTPRPIVEGFVARAGNSKHPDIVRWHDRSAALLADPKSFDYDLWCGGGYANEAT